ncbi:hypothetical protein [Heliomicrobium modesticaldum]|nr:hypothetical protein [Heliomicrobium modesticaldum]
MKTKSIVLIALLLTPALAACNTYDKPATSVIENAVNIRSQEKGQEMSTPSLKINNPGSRYYQVIKENKPEVSNESEKFKNKELLDLNSKIKFKPISGIDFLNNNNIIFSVLNGKNNPDDSSANS